MILVFSFFFVFFLFLFCFCFFDYLYYYYLSLKSPHGELTIKFVLYCIVLYCKSGPINSLLMLWRRRSRLIYLICCRDKLDQAFFGRNLNWRQIWIRISLLSGRSSHLRRQAFTMPFLRWSDVTTMLFRVFSRSLDQEKTWYALNDRLCGKQPRKFSEGSFFQLFPD